MYSYGIEDNLKNMYNKSNLILYHLHNIHPWHMYKIVSWKVNNNKCIQKSRSIEIKCYRKDNYDNENYDGFFKEKMLG